ncbi:hypothetical protein J6590_047296 [Homalodisca vitripennis]|nr:hypothetical protein J6590_047296 [Homalodisca vitripennis]
MEGIAIEGSDSTRDLGVIIAFSLQFRAHRQHLYQNISNAKIHCKVGWIWACLAGSGDSNPFRGGSLEYQGQCVEIKQYYKLLSLSSGRKLSDLTLLHKILNGKIDCSALYRLFNIKVPSVTLCQHLFATGQYGTNYQLHSPIQRVQREGNSVCRNRGHFLLTPRLPSGDRWYSVS